MRVVSNTSPICYLILIGEIQILPQLFSEIVIPPAVRDELAHPDAPTAVRHWTASPPEWLRVTRPSMSEKDPDLERLDIGEREAISLAKELQADLLLIDDWKARELARNRKLPITGLIGILDSAIERSLVEAGTVVQRLRSTTFRVSKHLLETLLE